MLYVIEWLTEGPVCFCVFDLELETEGGISRLAPLAGRCQSLERLSFALQTLWVIHWFQRRHPAQIEAHDMLQWERYRGHHTAL